MNDKQQQIQDLINLNKDPDLAIFKAIKAVGDKVGIMEQSMKEKPKEEEMIINLEIL